MHPTNSTPADPCRISKVTVQPAAVGQSKFQVQFTGHRLEPAVFQLVCLKRNVTGNRTGFDFLLYADQHNVTTDRLRNNTQGRAVEFHVAAD